MKQIKSIKKLVNNDVFAKEIRSEDKEFDGRYFLFIRSEISNVLEDERYPFYRVKITKDNEIPETKEEIEQLEYIQFGIEDYVTALDNQKEIEADHQSFMVDEFGYLPVYRCSFPSYYRSDKFGKIIYIGNFELEKPKNEYIYYSAINGGLIIWKGVNIELIKRYLKYNKKDPSIYNHEVAEIRRENYMMNKKIMEQVVKHSKEVIAKHGSEIEAIMEKKPYIEDSLTYVGEEANEQTSNGVRDIIR